MITHFKPLFAVEKKHPMTSKHFCFVLLHLFLAFLGCAKHPPAQIAQPKLVLFLVVDQFPEEYFERFAHLLSGGLSQLRKSGVVFTETRYQHAITTTCPGHATLITGSHPRTHGIVDSSWFDSQQQSRQQCAEDEHGRPSPTMLQTSTLPDWLLGRYRGAKLYSISGKDRAAIMLGGRSADAALWYNDSRGEFTTSSYYLSTTPWWLENFNQQRKVDSYFGTLWQPLAVAPEAVTQADIATLEGSTIRESQGFAHAFGGPAIIPGKSFYRAFGRSPFLDGVTVDLAKQLIHAERLGKDSTPDFLAVSFSAIDRIGHSFGPNSPEVLDAVLRLDRLLAEFFEFLDQEIGLEHVLVSFSSDHGVQPLPEYRLAKGKSAHRITSEDIVCVQQINKALETRFGKHKLMVRDFYLNHALLKRLGLRAAEVDAVVKEHAQRCAPVETLWSARELLATHSDTSAPARPYYLSYYESRSPDYLPQLKQYALARPRGGTGHGSPYPYDTHVPMIFLHPELPAKIVKQPAAPTDLAVSIAALVGLDVPETIDGTAQTEALLRRSR